MKRKILGLLVLVCILVACCFCLSIGYAEKCDHPAPEIRPYLDAEGKIITQPSSGDAGVWKTTGKTDYYQEPDGHTNSYYSKHKRSVDFVGECQKCGEPNVTAFYNFETDEHHFLVYIGYDKEFNSEKWQCKECTAYTTPFHICRAPYIEPDDKTPQQYLSTYKDPFGDYHQHKYRVRYICSICGNPQWKDVEGPEIPHSFTIYTGYEWSDGKTRSADNINHETRYFRRYECSDPYCNETFDKETWRSYPHTRGKMIEGTEEKKNTIREKDDKKHEIMYVASFECSLCHDPFQGIIWKEDDHVHEFDMITAKMQPSTIKSVKIDEDKHLKYYIVDEMVCECGHKLYNEVFPIPEVHHFAPLEGTGIPTGKAEENNQDPGTHYIMYSGPCACECDMEHPITMTYPGETKKHEFNIGIQGYNYDKESTYLRTDQYDDKKHLNIHRDLLNCVCGAQGLGEYGLPEEHKQLAPATCTSPAVCKCGRTIEAARGHDYDYDHPQKERGEYVVRFNCKRPECIDYIIHSHNYENAKGATPVKTENYQKGNNNTHKRRYDIQQRCTCILGNGKQCTASIMAVYEWRNETHSFVNNGQATATDTYSQIVGDTSQHNRLYRQPKKCICGQTKTVTEWKKRSHSFVQKGETHGNCVTPSIIGYQCSKCLMDKTEEGDKDPDNHIALANRYTTVTKPTCTKKGSGYYPCTACGGKKTTTIAAKGHSWDSGIIIVYPTSTMPGQKRCTCTVCGTPQTISFR